jgi:CheY-like chemotaxis protein
MARILVADDHADTREVLGVILAGAGHDLFFAGDGKEALSRFRETCPDLALIDVFMPGKDGVQVIGEIRREFPSAKLIAISAGWTTVETGAGPFRSHDVLAEATRGGANATLAKPVEYETLVSVVDRVLCSG